MEERLAPGSPRFADLVRQRATRHAEKPRLDGYAAIVLSCWQDLRGERQAWGDRLGPVPYSAVRTWCADMGLDRDETRLVQQAVSLVDSEQGKRAEAERRLSGHGAAVERMKQEGKR